MLKYLDQVCLEDYQTQHFIEFQKFSYSSKPYAKQHDLRDNLVSGISYMHDEYQQH